MDIAFAHHLSLSYNAGGEKWLINVANDLTKRGHTVSIYALPILLDGKRKIDPNTLLRDTTYIEGFHFKVKADVCYVTYNPLSFLTFQTSHPRIAGLHAQSYWAKASTHYGIYPMTAKIAYSLIGSLDLKGYDAVHMVTDAYPIKHQQVFCIPNFVDSEVYEPCRKTDKFTVCYLSRNNWQKGYDIALATEQKLKGESDFRFSNGFIPECFMPRFIGSCHVAIVPSRVDTFGLSIVESLMCGTPVVTSGLLSHIRLGLPVQFADDITTYMQAILWYKHLWQEHPDLYNALCDTIRHEAMRKYSKYVVMDKLEEMFLRYAS